MIFKNRYLGKGGKHSSATAIEECSNFFYWGKSRSSFLLLKEKKNRSTKLREAVINMCKITRASTVWSRRYLWQESRVKNSKKRRNTNQCQEWAQTSATALCQLNRNQTIITPIENHFCWNPSAMIGSISQPNIPLSSCAATQYLLSHKNIISMKNFHLTWWARITS